MESRAIARYVDITPRKAGQVAKLVRGKTVAEALAMLKWVNKAGAPILSKVIKSSFANLQKEHVGSKPEETIVSTLAVDGGPILKYAKRFIPRAMGRASKIHKRTCHITAIVTEQPPKKGK